MSIYANPGGRRLTTQKRGAIFASAVGADITEPLTDNSPMVRSAVPLLAMPVQNCAAGSDPQLARIRQ
jgi:hypothetical protein